MKAYLMFKDRDFDLHGPLPPQAEALTQDLALDTLFDAMAGDDDFLLEVVAKAVLSSTTDLDTILHRQHVLADCLNNSEVVRAIYSIAIESLGVEKRGHWSFFTRDYPSGVLSRSIELLEGYLPLLRQLREIAERHVGQFDSDGFRKLFATLSAELSDAYFAEVNAHLKALRFNGGVLMSAGLAKGNKGAGYVLRRAADTRPAWMKWLLGPHPASFSFTIHPRDEAGWKNLAELKDRGISLVADALGQSAEHVLSFFQMLRSELAFYIGCINLHERLGEIGQSTTLPAPVAIGEHRLSAQGLYDICLCLSLGRGVVANDLNADNKDLIFVTGANQGGKSTFLRSVGLAQVMMQSGMFVGAESFCADVRDGVFTHHKREEDASMTSGKFDEELARMNGIVETLGKHGMVLFNESFAATNEREGSEIARQIVGALVESGVKVFFVTHMYHLAHGFYERQSGRFMFLRAQRQEGGERSFKILEAEPLRTSFGKDLYRQIFTDETDSADGGCGKGGGAADAVIVAAQQR